MYAGYNQHDIDAMKDFVELSSPMVVLGERAKCDTPGNINLPRCRLFIIVVSAECIEDYYDRSYVCDHLDDM